MTDINMVNHGVDTLVVNAYYTDDLGKRLKRDVDEGIASQLKQWKDAAIDAGTSVATSWFFRKVVLQLHPSGASGMWPWRLTSDLVTLLVGPGRMNGIAQVRFSSEYLWSCPTLTDAIYEVDCFLTEIFGATLTLQVSQVDLCVDLTGWDDIEHINCRRDFVSRSRKRTEYSACADWSEVADVEKHSEGLHFTGFTFSRHSSLSCRIYDKTRELLRSGKEWFKDLWERNGWDLEAAPPVWRVEFSFKRDVLREVKQEGVFHGIEDVYELVERMPVLWAYAVGHVGGGDDGLPDGWLRYVLPTADTNRARWQTHPVWEVVQAAFLHDPAIPEHFGKIIRKVKHQRNINKGVEAMLGYASSLAAWLGGPFIAEDSDLSAFLHWFYESGSQQLVKKDRDFSVEVQHKLLALSIETEENNSACTR